MTYYRWRDILALTNPVSCPNRTPEQAAHARPGKVDLYEKYIQTLRRSADLAGAAGGVRGGVLHLPLVLAVSAGAASSQNVGVKFWKERSDKESMANSGIDPDRTATLTRQANGTYTLTLPVMQVSKLGVTGYLSGLTIGDVTYDGTLTGDFNKATAVLTIKNLPASVLTGSDVNKSVLVTCNIQMDLQVLGEINTSARMCIWNQK